MQITLFIKNRVPTVIAGRPNIGRSTLIYILWNTEIATVSDIRYLIEDEIHIGGIRFRFVDMTGNREARDKIEALEIECT